MNNEIVSYEFNNSRISFFLGYEGHNYANATEMAKPFGINKSPGRWFRTKEARTLIQAVVRRMDIPEDQLVVIKKSFGEKQETWLHEMLAKEFARWLSFDFFLWTYQKLNEMINLKFAVDDYVMDMNLDLELLDFLDTKLEEEIKDINQMEKENNHLPIVLENRDLEIAESQPSIKLYYDGQSFTNGIPITIIAKELDMTAVRLNKLLNKLGVIYKIDKTWVLNQKFQSKGYTKCKAQKMEAKPSNLTSNSRMIWTPKGREFILKTISDYNQQESD